MYGMYVIFEDCRTEGFEVVRDRLPPRDQPCSRSAFAGAVKSMIEVAKLPEPTPLLHVDITKPGEDIRVSPGTLDLQSQTNWMVRKKSSLKKQAYTSDLEAAGSDEAKLADVYKNHFKAIGGSYFADCPVALKGNHPLPSPPDR